MSLMPSRKNGVAHRKRLCLLKRSCRSFGKRIFFIEASLSEKFRLSSLAVKYIMRVSNFL